MQFTRLLLLITAIFVNLIFAQEQVVEIGVRDAFLVSRIKTPNTLNKQSSPIVKNNKNTIGIGYTIYMRTSDNQCVSVDPIRHFRSGDSIRITFEPNVDCFIYIFYIENNGEPELLFPDKKLNDGNNKALTHTPFEIPSANNPDANLCWFNFSGEASNQQLYVVATKQPLAEVPKGDALAQYSQEHRKAWKPSKALWEQLKQKAQESITSKSKSYGQNQPKMEKESIGRRLSLSSNAPPPSVIQMSSSPTSTLLVAKIELIQD